MEHVKAPIPGDLPFGIYVKGEKSIYRALRNAFNAAQAAWRSLSETQESLENRELAAANTAAWTALAEQCETCLKETSKDLEILTWFTAAQLHRDRPLQNCAAVLTVLADLVEEHLEDLQPVPPSDKLKGDSDAARASEIAELRLRPFVQLVGEVEGSGLLAAPMTAHRLIGEVTYGKYILAEKNGTLDALRAEAGAALEAETEALVQNIEALQQMERQFDRLDVRLKKYAAQNGQMPPMIGYGRRIASDILAMVQRLVEGRGFPWPGAAEATSETEVPSGAAEHGEVAEAAPLAARGGAGSGFDPSANLANRTEALRAIARLATYFRTTEPHSPICLLLDRAVRWGNLSAGELYREILTGGSVGMAQMALMTGLESQGFSDTFGKRGAGTAGGIEHPTLPDYASALPVPTAPAVAGARAPAPRADPTPPMAPAALEPVAQDQVGVSTEPEVPESEPDLPVENFQW
jgi:type VI secretion system protein ImpA